MDICNKVNDIAIENKRAQLKLNAETLLADDLKKLDELIDGLDKEGTVAAMDSIIDTFIEDALADGRAKSAIDAVAFNVSEDNLEAAEEYIILKALDKNKAKVEKEIAVYMSGEQAGNMNIRYRTGATAVKVKNQLKGLFNSQLKSRLNDARNTLQAAGASIADEDDVYAEIKDLIKQLDEKASGENVVTYFENGQMVTAEVDPNLADIYNFSPTYNPTKAELFFGNAVFRAINRTARAFEVTLSPKSALKNQPIRDWTINFVTTGAYEGLNSMNKKAAALYRGTVTEWIKEHEPERYKDFQRISEETDTPVEDVVWSAELERGFSTVPGQTSFEYYKAPIRDGFSTELEETQNAFQKAFDKILSAPENFGNAREIWNRKRAYEKALTDGLAQGKSLDEARKMAEFARNNATINFWRGLQHFQAFQKTVNYFGASVNGFKSFWRMYSLDPVGVSCRLFGGIIVPVVVATGLMLANEEDRNKYRRLKEYEKKDQFIFSVDGQMFKIPIPQELGAIVSMVRHTTETLYDSARTDFWSLMMHDLLGAGPVDLSEVMLIDWNDYANDPTLWDRIGAMGRSLVNQMAPNAIKSVIEASTGIDTFTGERIDDSYWVFDDEGNRVLVGGTQREAALALGKATGWSPAVIAHFTESAVADMGADIIDTIVSGFNPASILEGSVSGAFDYTVKDYDRSNSDWNRTMSSLWDKKEELLKSYNDYNEEINKAATEEERNKLRAKRQDLISPFLDEAKTAVEKLKANDPNGYDRYRMAAVTSLLTFTTGTTSGDTAEARQRSKDTFYENRARAYQWMSELGVDASSDSSILGYVTQDANGNPVVKYNTPTQILAMREAWYGRADRDVAELKLLVEGGASNLKNEIQEVYNQRNAIYNSKQKLTDSDYDQIDAIYINWNSRVASAIRPYLERATAEEVLANDKVMDYLEDLFFVPGDYAINDKGKYVSLGSRGNKNDAYVRSYIKALYGVK